MTAAPPASVVSSPKEEETADIKRFVPPPEVVRLALSGAEGPYQVGDLLCRTISFDRCSPAVRLEKIVEALAAEPLEVRAAAAGEIQAALGEFTELSPYLRAKVVRRLALPDEPINFGEEHRARAAEVIEHVVAECAVCVVDVFQFYDKFVDEVILAQDSRGRAMYLLAVKSPDGSLTVKLPKSELCWDFIDKDNPGKPRVVTVCTVPEELNYVLTAKLGVALYSKEDLEKDYALRATGLLKNVERAPLHVIGKNLLSLIELNAQPDLLAREIALRQALRELLTKGGSGAVPVLYKNTVYGRWCDDGFLYIPTKFLGEIIDAMAVRFGSRRAFVSTAQYLGLLRQPIWRFRYAPAAEDHYTCPASNPRCAHAYVFHVDALAKFLDVSEEELCGK
jgi:hypothetical protein